MCSACHDAVHKDAKAKEDLSQKKIGQVKKYAADSILNQVMLRLIEYAIGLNGIKVYLSTGKETILVRELFGLEKDHHIDAWCIAVSLLETPPTNAPERFDGSIRHDVVQFRRHDRQINRCYHDRKYFLEGKVVARNRHKRTGQTEDSLEEFAIKHPESIARLSVVSELRICSQDKLP